MKAGRKIFYWVILVILFLALVNAFLILRTPDEHRYDAHISNVVRLNPIDPQILRAVIWRESNFDPTIVGRAQERGLMQVTPGAGREWAQSAKVRNFQEDDLFDPYTNIRAGAWYLNRALRRYSDRDDPLAFALAEYNAGRVNVRRWIDPDNPLSHDAFLDRMDFPTTKKYILSIERRYELYKADEQRPAWLRWCYSTLRRWGLTPLTSYFSRSSQQSQAASSPAESQPASVSAPANDPQPPVDSPAPTSPAM
jgi:soluble lytic murein transglycosylase